MKLKLFSMMAAGTAAAVLMSGCAMTVGSPATGFVYTKAKGPGHAATPNAMVKTGEATCTSILGIVANGDCSISTAAKNGGITKVATVDYDVTNVLYLYATTTVIVTGE
jgi:hypothetical protein